LIRAETRTFACWQRELADASSGDVPACRDRALLRTQRERTEHAAYKLYQTAALAACTPEAQGGQRRSAAHYHCILRRRWAGFGVQLPLRWRTADQSRMESSYGPVELPKQTLLQEKTAQGRNAAHYHGMVHRKRTGFGAQLPRSWRTAEQSRMQ
jgi:hypothetical protein